MRAAVRAGCDLGGPPALAVPLKMKKTYPCSICGRQVNYEGPLPALYPFCCERCQMVDLGRWFNEQYAIDHDLTPEDLPQGFPPPDSCEQR